MTPLEMAAEVIREAAASFDRAVAAFAAGPSRLQGALEYARSPQAAAQQLAIQQAAASRPVGLTPLGQANAWAQQLPMQLGQMTPQQQAANAALFASQTRKLGLTREQADSVEAARDARMKENKANDTGVVGQLGAAASYVTGTFGMLSRAVLSTRDRLFSLGDTVSGWAGRANPNARATYEGSIDALMRSFGKGFISATERGSSFVQRLRPVAEVTGTAGATWLEHMTRAARPILEPVSRGAAYMAGMFGGGGSQAQLSSLATKQAWAAASGDDGGSGKPPKRSMAGLPTATIGGMEDFYDRGVAESLSMGAGTLESDKFAEQVKEMAKTIGDLIVKLDANTQQLREQPNPFR